MQHRAARKPTALVGRSCHALVLAFGCALLLSASAEATRPVLGLPHALGDVQLEVASQGETAVLGPTSFCARPNGTAVALPCGGRARPPLRRPLPAHSGGTLSYRFGAPLSAVFASLDEVRGKRLIQLTPPVPLAAGGRPAATTQKLARVRVAAGHEVVLQILAIYAGPVRLGPSGRPATPFDGASAFFQIPLRFHRHRGGCPGGKCNTPPRPPPSPGGR